MKKILKVLLFISIFSIFLTACGKNNNEKTEVSFNVSALKGPTAIGLVNMMDTNKENNYSISTTPDEVVSKIVNKEVDIAAVPANLASVLYNKTEGDICVLAINTLGVLYIVENSDNINSLDDLKGKTVWATGKGATPEYALNYILQKAGIEKDVKVEFKTEHSELASLLAENKIDIAMLPQPFVYSAMSKNPNLRIALNLTEEWEKLDENSTMITGVLVARKSVVEENKDAINKFLDNYKISIENANNNLEKTAQLTQDFDILPKEIALKAIPECNITYIDGQDMQDLLSKYLEILNIQNPKSIGGKLPNEDFYYKK